MTSSQKKLAAHSASSLSGAHGTAAAKAARKMEEAGVPTDSIDEIDTIDGNGAAGAVDSAAQQPPPTVPEEMQVISPARQQLSGPRFGLTVFTGDVAELRRSAGKSALMTQFGWQWETRLLSTQTGAQALMEWVALVGGVEQDEFNVSVSWLAGIRFASGVEFGAGPNFTVTKDSEDVSTSMIVAGGATVEFGEFYIPLNLAVGIAQGGPRLTALMGWIVG